MNIIQDSYIKRNNAKKYLYVLFPVLLIFSVSQAQEIKKDTIKDPIIDTSLNIGKLTSPLYIINNDYAIFQDENNQQVIIHPDIQTFKIEEDGRGLFATDKNGVYFKGKFIKTSSDGFARLNECGYGYNSNCIWKTHNKVFRDTTNITKNIDVLSFQQLSNTYFYFVDKNFIYFNGEKIEKSDGSTANTTLNGVAYDKNYLYSNGNIATYNGDTIRSINAVLGKTKKYVFKYPLFTDIQTQIDVKTIRPLSRQYSMDKNGVYFWNEKLPILPKDFDKIKVWEQNGSQAISDGKNVYNGNQVFQYDIDAKTYGILSKANCFFDKNGIYLTKWNQEKQKSEIVKIPFDYTKRVTSQNTFNGKHYRYLIYDNQVYDFSRQKVFKNLSENDINLVRNTYKTINQVDGKIIVVPTITDSLETMGSAEGNIIYKGKEKLYKLHGKNLIELVDIDHQTSTVNNQNFLADKDYIYANEYRIIKNEELELLAVFKIPIKPKSSDDKKNKEVALLFINAYLFKNNEGYWLVAINNRKYTNNGEVRIKSLGTELNDDFKKLLPTK